ncbi:MAG: aldo/keto reductase [Alphaproteobacteria bacterium]|nr:aldo/keto reductase [Alphaproteobacteria bacterium]
MRDLRLDRRTFLAASAAAAVAPAVKAQPSILTRAIPKSNQAIPLVGLGSWITFNVGNDPTGRAASTAVMRAFFAAGGRLIDSSPMYGSSQEVIGEGIRKAGNAQRLFAATKVWISGGSNGPTQIEESRRLWTIPKFDLLQVHNLLSWEEHLPTLFAMKAAGKLRYVGVTTSHGRRHDDLERIMRTQPIDFIQVTYNVASRDVEARVLPLAAERRIAVIINRPFEGGDLIAETKGKPLPAWAGEIGCKSWAQIMLKFIISHPAVTCPIPATTRVDHVQENLAAASGILPDKAMRARILAAVGTA